MAKEKAKVKMNADEIKEYLIHLINNNRFIQAQGKIPIGVNIEGEAGLGKTSIVLQLGKELGLPVVKRNLAEIEELGDIVGFPIRQFQLCKERDMTAQEIEAVKEKNPKSTDTRINDCQWIDEMAISEYIKQGFSFTGKKRMSYCPPDWIEGIKEGGILFLDDFSRADSRMIQAAMEIINRQEYISWKLPKDCHIIMSSNPDNGHYMVNSQDMAHQTRYSTVVMKFDVECWARQAEKDQIDGRCINFLLKHPDIMKEENLREGINPRSMTNFFNSISSLQDFEQSLPQIQNIGESSIGSEATTMFTTFINQRLDKLISPKDILEKEWKHVKGEIVASHGKGKEYRPDIASIMTTRVINYSLYHAEKKPVDQKMIDRITTLATDDEVLAMDLKYFIIKELLNKQKQKFQKLMLHPGIVKMTVK